MEKVKCCYFTGDCKVAEDRPEEGRKESPLVSTGGKREKKAGKY